jgi:hypothetical protein
MQHPTHPTFGVSVPWADLGAVPGARCPVEACSGLRPCLFGLAVVRNDIGQLGLALWLYDEEMCGKLSEI